MEINPILLEVFKNRLSSISEEMGVTLNRTAYSPNIKERRDFSCALFDENGDMVAQAAHIPVHLGSMPMSVKSAIESVKMVEGDMVMLNDPFKGGTHLPDVTIVAPVFIEKYEKPKFYVANRAHHSDVGGMSAGSMPLSTRIFQEGIIIPPLKIIEKGKVDKKIMAFFLNNIRTPVEREGDFASQIMANMTGIKRITELVDKYGFKMINFYCRSLIDYSEKIMRSMIKTLPVGSYQFCDYMDDDGLGNENIKIHVNLHIYDDNVVLDFSDSDAQVPGNINAVYAITLSAVLYVFRSLVNIDIPTNKGCFRPIKVKTVKGSIVDAEYPSAVAAGNVETSQRIVDVVLGALSKALPDIIPAASQGTMNNVAIGGIDHRNNMPFTYYETIGGGMGASSKGDGESAVHSHMTNTLNTPIEALEFSYPFKVKKYCIRRNSGGKGLNNGGNGIIREVMASADMEVTVLSERRKNPPYGILGGGSGLCGKNYVVKDGISIEKSSKFTDKLKCGDILIVETPGGGAYKA